MHEWITNGAQFAWLIEPEQKSVTIYRPGSAPETRSSLEQISGEGILEACKLDLTFIWNPFAS